MNKQLSDLALRDTRHVLPHYTNISKRRVDGPAIITGGDRVYVHDEDGRRYLDGTSGMFAASFGFSEQELIDAAKAQLDRLPYYHFGLYKGHGPSVELAEMIADRVPIPNARIHYANSGSEAHEFLVKFLWYANHALDRPQKRKILAHVNSWHGSTIFSVSMSGISKCHQGFGLPLPEVVHVPEPHYYRHARDGESEAEFSDRLIADTREIIEREGPENIAAMILEPFACAAGIVPRPASYHEKLQAMLKEFDIWLLTDEVVTGFGRTGGLFGSTEANLLPDAMSFAKGLTSGYGPLAAFAISEEIDEAIVKGNDAVGFFAHGTTFSGHPVSCAIAIRALQLIDERGMLQHVRDMSTVMQRHLERYRDHPLVGDIRGAGLMWGLEMIADRDSRKPLKYTGAAGNQLAVNAEEHGLIIRNLSGGDTVGFVPPLIINEDEIADMFQRFGAAFEDTVRWIEEKGLAEV